MFLHTFQNIAHLLGPKSWFGHFWAWGGGGRQSACRSLGPIIMLWWSLEDLRHIYIPCYVLLKIYGICILSVIGSIANSLHEDTYICTHTRLGKAYIGCPRGWGSLGIMEEPLKPSNTIVLWCTRDFRGVPTIPRMSDRSSFSSVAPRLMLS